MSRPSWQGQPQPDDDPEDRDPGLARERTSLAWTRTAISFAALGGAVLKENAITGLVILAITPVIWQIGRASLGKATQADAPRANLLSVAPARLFIITASIVAVSLLCLVVAVFGKAVPGALR